MTAAVLLGISLMARISTGLVAVIAVFLTLRAGILDYVGTQNSEMQPSLQAFERKTIIFFTALLCVCEVAIGGWVIFFL